MALPKNTLPDPEHEEMIQAVDLTKDEEESPSSSEGSSDATMVKTGRGQHGESDASRGGKTSKDGKQNYFFGYDVEAMVRVPALTMDEKKVRTEPNLLERLVVIPAGADIVRPCLRMFDRMFAEGKKLAQFWLIDITVTKNLIGGYKNSLTATSNKSAIYTITIKVLRIGMA